MEPKYTISPLILENSPVSFAIMGPGESHRCVLVRSSDKNLDLVGLDSLDSIGSPLRAFSPSVLSFWRFDSAHLDCFIVRGSTNYSINEDFGESNSRKTYISFAWRGLATEQDVAMIKDWFRHLSLDLSVTLVNDNTAALEWQIASLIALCEQATTRVKKRVQSFKLAAWVSFGFYIIVAIAVALKYAGIVYF